jgi:hypothetical protein
MQNSIILENVKNNFLIKQIQNIMKNLTIVISLFLILFLPGIKLLSSDNPITTKKVFSYEDIKKLTNVYVENNLGIKNPAIVDVDGDGDFDILIFNDGNVEYYKNTGTLENPFFVPENMKYDTYIAASFIDLKLPKPVFFADRNGDGKPDMFVVRDKIFDTKLQKSEYRVLYAQNFLGLDTGVLITIILVLIIVVLLIAIF